MLIIKIPHLENKINFIYQIIYKIKEKFDCYDFINCTDSPIQEFQYRKMGKVFVRKLGEQKKHLKINNANYEQSYHLDNIEKQGLSLSEYIEHCLIFELNTIYICKKNINFFCEEDLINKSVAIFLICPDGLDEIHIEAKEKILNVMSNILKS